MSSELPQSRIKKIIKLDPEYSGVSASAVHLITRATEIFIQDLTSKASIETRRQQRKKIMYDDFHSVIKNNQSLYFLSDVVPKKYVARELIKDKKIQLREEVDQQVLDEPTVEKAEEKLVPRKVATARPQGILSFTNNNSNSESPAPVSVTPEVVEINEKEDTIEPDVNPNQEQAEDAMVIDVSDDNDEDEDEDEDDVMIDS